MKKPTMPSVDVIVDRLGGPTRAARALFTTRMTVHRWRDKDEMPPIVMAYIALVRPDALQPVAKVVR